MVNEWLAITSWMLLAVYCVAAWYYGRDFWQKEPRDRQMAQRWIAAALGLHLLYLVSLTISLARLPVATVSESIGTFVWLSAVIYWALEQGILARRSDDRTMGTFILPILCILLLISNLTFRSDEEISPVLEDVRFELHVLALLLAYSALTISFIASLLHTLLARELKKREVGMFYNRLPSLAFFDRISNAAVDVGLIFMTIGLLYGVFSALQVWDALVFSEVKFGAAVFSWLVYGIHFAGRRLAGWGGQVGALLSIIGYLSILFSFIVISTLFTSVHHFV